MCGSFISLLFFPMYLNYYNFHKSNCRNQNIKYYLGEIYVCIYMHGWVGAGPGEILNTSKSLLIKSFTLFHVSLSLEFRNEGPLYYVQFATTPWDGCTFSINYFVFFKLFRISGPHSPNSYMYIQCHRFFIVSTSILMIYNDIREWIILAFNLSQLQIFIMI